MRQTPGPLLVAAPDAAWQAAIIIPRGAIGVWQFEATGGEWLPFSPAASKLLDQAQKKVKPSMVDCWQGNQLVQGESQVQLPSCIVLLDSMVRVSGLGPSGERLHPWSAVRKCEVITPECNKGHQCLPTPWVAEGIYKTGWHCDR